MTEVSRRVFVGGGLAASMTWTLGQPTVSADPPGAPQPDIQAREAWGADLPATGPLEQEAPGDVRFLLVHHTETPNGYGPDAVVPRLQNIFGYHTGTKGWPDIAYNFFVDAQGRIWEGRTGSLAGPVKGDATGGSQGFAQLCCFLGSHQSEPPTPAAVSAMSALTAWLAGRYGVDLFAGPTITFTSRGSNRWPAGALVTTDPLAGHRDMSQTACPGDAAYPLVRGEILRGAQARSPQATTTAAPTTTTSAAAPATSTTTPAAPSTSRTSTSAPTTAPAPSASSSGGSGPSAGVIGLAAAGVTAIAGAGLVLRSRRARAADAPPASAGGQTDQTDETDETDETDGA